MCDALKKNDLEARGKLDLEELAAVSGGSEWILEEEVPGETDAFRTSRKEKEDRTPAAGGTDLIGAGIMDRAALSLDRLRESLTRSATKE